MHCAGGCLFFGPFVQVQRRANVAPDREFVSRSSGISGCVRRAWMSGRSQDRASNTKLLSSGARAAMWETSCGVQSRALTTHATVDCGGAAGGRGMQGAAPVLSCHER